MRVMHWDVRVGGPSRLPLIEHIDADVLLLLGVSRKSSRDWKRRWADRYSWAHAGLDLVESPQQQPHGAMIAAKWPLSEVRVLDWLPKPERGLVATLHHDVGPITLASWGAPNAAGETRQVKSDAYQRMNRFLPMLPGPIVMGVDTNAWGDHPRRDEPDPPENVFRNEHEFLSRHAPHGLTDVYRDLIERDEHRARLLADLRPHGPLGVTYIRRPHKRPRGIAGPFLSSPAFGLDRMDRLYVSDGASARACELLYHEAAASGGDHAAVIAGLDVFASELSASYVTMANARAVVAGAAARTVPRP